MMNVLPLLAGIAFFLVPAIHAAMPVKSGEKQWDPNPAEVRKAEQILQEAGVLPAPQSGTNRIGIVPNMQLELGFPLARTQNSQTFTTGVAGMLFGLQTQAKTVAGIQLGVLNRVESAYGLQGGLFNGAGFSAFQLGCMNQSTESIVQTGIVNIARQQTYVQFGLLNYNSNGFFPCFPFLNISWP